MEGEPALVAAKSSISNFGEVRVHAPCLVSALGARICRDHYRGMANLSVTACSLPELAVDVGCEEIF